jgi:hypothetical protein
MMGLVMSGVTAIPLQLETQWLRSWCEPLFGLNHPVSQWLERVAQALEVVQRQFPFLAYGTDWLAFGHFVIALAFWGAWRHPTRNAWLFDFGLWACALVIPYALIFGAIRGVPIWWRCLDAGFGMIGAIPLLLARGWVKQLAERARSITATDWHTPHHG